MDFSVHPAKVFFNSIAKLRFAIENRAAGIHALIAASQNRGFLLAPLGARARLARLKGVFSVGEAAEKTDFIIKKLSIFRKEKE